MSWGQIFNVPNNFNCVSVLSGKTVNTDMPTFEIRKEGCFSAERRKIFFDLFSSESAIIRKFNT